MYKPFRNSILVALVGWDKLVKMNREEVVDLQEEWERTNKENSQLYDINCKKKEEELKNIKEVLRKSGIDILKYKKKGFIREASGYQNWYKNNVVDIINMRYPYYNKGLPIGDVGSKTVDGINIRNGRSPIGLVELYDKLVVEYNNGIKIEKKNNNLLVKSIEYAIKNDINIEGLDEKEIIDNIEFESRDKYARENIIDGDEIHLKGECDECSSYIVGEQRCECGNRRINIIIEGNLQDGYWHYPESY